MIAIEFYSQIIRTEELIQQRVNNGDKVLEEWVKIVNWNQTNNLFEISFQIIRVLVLFIARTQ